MGQEETLESKMVIGLVMLISFALISCSTILYIELCGASNLQPDHLGDLEV